MYASMAASCSRDGQDFLFLGWHLADSVEEYTMLEIKRAPAFVCD
jgi:hypothetical protein